METSNSDIPQPRPEPPTVECLSLLLRRVGERVVHLIDRTADLYEAHLAVAEATPIEPAPPIQDDPDPDYDSDAPPPTSS